MPLLQTPLKKVTCQNQKQGILLKGVSKKARQIRQKRQIVIEIDHEGFTKHLGTGAPEVWACRYCGLKGDKPSMMEKHDCPEQEDWEETAPWVKESRGWTYDEAEAFKEKVARLGRQRFVETG